MPLEAQEQVVLRRYVGAIDEDDLPSAFAENQDVSRLKGDEEPSSPGIGGSDRFPRHYPREGFRILIVPNEFVGRIPHYAREHFLPGNAFVHLHRDRRILRKLEHRPPPRKLFERYLECRHGELREIISEAIRAEKRHSDQARRAPGEGI